MYKFLKILFLGFSIAIFSSENIHSQNCIFKFDSTVSVIDGFNIDISPGDTINLLKGHRYFLLLKNINGNKDSVITIRNYDGKVIIDTNFYYGIKFESSSFIKLSGAYIDSIKYGIQILKVEGAGISVDNKSTDVEIENIEIANTSIAGIYAKTDPDCSFTAVRDSFTMYNIYIHDNYLHDIANEGMYIGSSFYTGKTLNCNGKDTLIYPHVIEGVKVYNNILKNIGWDGIQVSSAISDCNIYNNYISNDSYSETYNQMSGILIGGGSKCDCYNNIIVDGKGDGIDVLGLGNEKIFNNLIINPGKNYHPELPVNQYQKHGIYITNLSTLPNAFYNIFNNTIISPKTNGILFRNTESKNNKIYNNIIISPGALNIYGDAAYIYSQPPGIDIDISHNYKDSDFDDIKFINPEENNFALQGSSPVIDQGLNLSEYGIDFDIYNYPRPYGDNFDIGAFEYSPETQNINEYSYNKKTSIKIKNIYPNPFNKSTTIQYSLFFSTFINISVFNNLGQKVKEILNENQNKGDHIIIFKSDDLTDGIYFINYKTNNENITKKVMIYKK
ncbi:MAG: T9SS type A sorting domain-containing protein [Bacteroidales bacterium]|nr:T9SS type A sorting domain-containing protein [Bacteroidales bacterium]